MGTLMQRPWQALLPPPEVKLVTDSVVKTLVRKAFELGRAHPRLKHDGDGEPCLGHCDQCGAVCLSQAAPTLNAAQNRARR